MKRFLGIGLLACALPAMAAKPELVNFPASARVVIDAQGVPQQVHVNERLPAFARHAIEQRILQWRFQPAQVGGVAKPGVTHVNLQACAIPQPGGTLSLGMDYSYNGPTYADNRLRPIPPRYPVDAAKRGEEGVFRILFQVQTDGSAVVQSIEVQDGELKRFESTLRGWIHAQRFVPEEVDGKPIATVMATVVDFNMGHDIGPSARRKERAAARTSPECMAASGAPADAERTMVLDSPFRPLETS